MPGPEPLLEALREVQDPEMPVNLVDLGIVYGVVPPPEPAALRQCCV